MTPRVLRLDGLRHGTGLAKRARDARYQALGCACASKGILHLLVGHHRADQAETLRMRMLAGSGPFGLAGMAALVETSDIRLLRPLLDIPPGRLRATLHARGVTWTEDPSNTDPASLRARLRAASADPEGSGPAIASLMAASLRRGGARREAERLAAAWLARHAEIRPEGYALLDHGPWHEVAIASLLRMLAGAAHLPSPSQVARLAAAPRAVTLGGVRIMPAGRWRPGGWLLAREEAALGPAIAAAAGATWDGRFRLAAPHVSSAVLGALGRDRSVALPAAVKRTLGVLRGAGPGGDAAPFTRTDVVFSPPSPAACAPFVQVQAGC